MLKFELLFKLMFQSLGEVRITPLIFLQYQLLLHKHWMDTQDL